MDECRNTPEVHAGGIKYDYVRVAAEKINAGTLVAQNGEGLAVPAADAAGLIVLGRAENSVQAGEKAVVKRGVFIYDNGADTEALTVGDIGKECFVVDDVTVGIVGGTNKVKAGRVLDVTPEGVAVII